MEEPILIITVMVTVSLGALAALCAVIGIVFRRVERARSLAPFVAFVPTLAMLGALVCSWGLGFLVAMFGPQFHGHAWWAWLVGLPVGGVLGGRLGLSAARSFRKRDETSTQI